MKLNFELVPYNAWCSNLRSVLTEESWDILRKDVYKKAGYKCEICGKTNVVLEAHETWSYNIKTKKQKLKTVRALCHDCHSTIHIGLAEVNGHLNKSLNYYMNINKLNIDQVVLDYKKAYKKWEKRNQVKEWELDLKWLEKNEYNLNFKESKK